MKMTREYRKQQQQSGTKDMTEDEEYIEYISPYTIKNATGYSIEILADNVSKEESKQHELSSISESKSRYANAVFACNDGASVNYLVEVDLNHLLGQSPSSLNSRIKFYIKHDKLSINPVYGINLQSSHPTERALECTRKNGNAFQEKYSLAIQTEILENNKKILLISSCVQIKNNLSMTLKLLLENEDEKIERVVESGETISVPFDFIAKGFLTVLNTENPTVSGSRSSILSYLDSAKKYHYIAIKERNYVITPTKKSHITYLEFNPPFVIKNCCPLPLLYEVFAPSSTALCDKLEPQEARQVVEFSNSKKVIAKIRMQGLEWSAESIIYSENPLSIVDCINLKGIETGSLSINVASAFDASGIYKIFFYCKTVIINETLLALMFYSCDEFNENNRKYLPGQDPIDKDDDFDTRTILYGDSKKLAVAIKKSPKTVSGSFPVHVLGDQSIILEDFAQSRAIELGINVSIHTAGNQTFIG